MQPSTSSGMGSHLPQQPVTQQRGAQLAARRLHLRLHRPQQAVLQQHVQRRCLCRCCWPQRCRRQLAGAAAWPVAPQLVARAA